MVVRTYCLACKKHTDNIAPRNVSMANKVIREKVQKKYKKIYM